MCCLLRFGAVAGSMAGIIASLITFFLWHHPWNIIIFSAEAIFVAYLFGRRQIDLLNAVVIYWVIPGAGLGWIFYHGVMGIQGDIVLLLIVKQAVNSIINALLAMCGYTLFSGIRGSGVRRPRYRQFITVIMLALILFPALIYVALDMREDQANGHEAARKETRTISRLVQATVNQWLLKEHQVVKTLAAVVDPEVMPGVEMQRLAEAYLENDGSLKGIGIMNPSAVSVAYAPGFDSLERSTLGLDLSQRPYLAVVRDQRQPYVGDVQLSKVTPGGSELPLLAPIVVDSKYKGFCRGIVDLAGVQSLVATIAGPRGVDITLIDRQRRIITSTDSSLQVMAPWSQAKGEIRSLGNDLSLWIPSAVVGSSPFSRWHRAYYFSEVRLSSEIGWTMRVEVPLLPVITHIGGRATNAFLLMVGLVIVVNGLAYVVSRYHIQDIVTLQELTAQVARDPQVAVSCWPVSPILEVDLLSQNLGQMADGLRSRIHQLNHLNQHLDELVQLRTAEVTNVNCKLLDAQRIAHLGSWELDLRTETLTWSEEIYRIFEVDPNQFGASYQAFLALAHPDDRATVEQIYSASLSSGQPYEITHRLLMPDGRVKHVHERGETEYDLEGKAILTRGTVHDITDLVMADQARQRAEFRYQAVFNQSPDGMVIFDPLCRGRAIEFNDAACRQLGYSREEFAGLSISDYDLVESPAETEAHIKQVFEGGSDDFETRHRTRGGEVPTVHVSVTRFQEQGRDLILGIHRDITARKQVEEALRESQELFALLMRYTPVYTFVKVIENGVSRSLALSDNFQEMLGRPAQSMIGKSMEELFPVDFARTITADDIAVVAKGEIVEIEERYADRVYTTIKFPIFRAARSTLLAGFTMDITARKRLDLALQQSEERYRNLVEHATVWIWETDTTLRHTYSNAQIEGMLGYPVEEFLAMEIFDLVHTDDHDTLRAIALRGLTEKEPWQHVVIRWRHRDGSWRFFESSGTPFFDADGAVCGLRGVDVDITQRWQAQEALRELNRTLDLWVKDETNARMKNEMMLIQQSKMAAMGEMIGAIAHQWRQPLNAVAAIVQDIKGAFSEDDLDREYLQQSVTDAMQQLRFMSKTVDDFRNFFQPDKVREEFDVKKAMVEVMAMVAAQFRSHAIDWQVTCVPHDRTFGPNDQVELCDAMTLCGFENELKQVFLNLINNGRDSINERRQEQGVPELRGRIEVAFARDGERIVIRVADNGKGVPSHLLGRIFEPYFTTKDQGQGTGIGLYMTKMIVENSMGGRIEVNNLTEGAEFIIGLPL